MCLFSKIFPKPRRSPHRSTRRERELAAEIEQQLQRPPKIDLALGDQVRWSEPSNRDGSGTVVKIVRRRGVGAETAITVLDSDNRHLRFFTEWPSNWEYTSPASLYRTGTRVTLASAIAKHRREVATSLGVTAQSPRVAHLGEDWGEYTEY
jgi:hypothetical protein